MWQEIIVGICIALAVAAVVRKVFFSKGCGSDSGCSSCSSQGSCHSGSAPSDQPPTPPSR